MILREINDELNLASLSCIEGWCRATETMSRQVCVCVITFGCVCASQQQVSPVRCCTASRAVICRKTSPTHTNGHGTRRTNQTLLPRSVAKQRANLFCSPSQVTLA